jgi:intein-encoded DNA endonuclease-like protein
MPYKAWNKGLNKENNASLAKIAKARSAKNNFASWQKEHPVHYATLKRDEDLAFLIGLVLGDGNIHAHTRTESLTLALGTDKPELWQYASAVLEKIFLKKPYVAKIKASECIRVRIYQKHISEGLGISTGARGNLTIEIPEWIENNKKFLISYLKGLFEAEGSFCIHLPTCTYNFAFANRNKSLLSIVEKSLSKLGFTPRRRPFNIALRKREEALAFEKLISFRKYPRI